MSINPDALILHGYIVGMAVVLALAFGVGWAFVPLLLGFVATLVGDNL